jgi:BirA family biotin operon repressor/biotin-[acetyl-CoA-carboxylase] ligase
MGLNVNARQQDLPEEIRPVDTSLRILTGRMIDRAALARALLRALDRWYADVARTRYDRITQQWRQYSADLGERITVEHGGHRYRGRVLDLSVEEGLVLRLDYGATRVFNGARVSVIRDDREQP